MLFPLRFSLFTYLYHRNSRIPILFRKLYVTVSIYCQTVPELPDGSCFQLVLMSFHTSRPPYLLVHEILESWSHSEALAAFGGAW